METNAITFISIKLQNTHDYHNDPDHCVKSELRFAFQSWPGLIAGRLFYAHLMLMKRTGLDQVFV